LSQLKLSNDDTGHIPVLPVRIKIFSSFFEKDFQGQLLTEDRRDFTALLGLPPPVLPLPSGGA
jgi:hypothetical protein